MRDEQFDRVVRAFPVAPAAEPYLVRLQEELPGLGLAAIKTHATRAIVEGLVETSVDGFRLTDAGERYLAGAPSAA